MAMPPHLDSVAGLYFKRTTYLVPVHFCHGFSHLNTLVAEEDIHPVVDNLVPVVDRHGLLAVGSLVVGNLLAVVVPEAGSRHIDLVEVDHTDLEVDHIGPEEDLVAVRIDFPADHNCLVVEVAKRSIHLAYRTNDRCYRAAI